NASTVQVDATVGGGGLYRGANSDGSKVYFSKGGDLYGYDVETGTTTDLAPKAQLMGVMGVSSDGSHIYFVAASVLNSNQNAAGETAQEGTPNLYLDDKGETTFVTRLLPEDDTFLGPSPNGENFPGRFGDWRASLS